MKKQTAVELLYEEISRPDWSELPKSMKSEIFEQAKEMEKEQIIEAFENGEVCTIFKNEGTSNQYYNETYKNTDK